MNTTAQMSVFESMMSDIRCMISEQNTITKSLPKQITRTIKDFTGMEGAVKMELSAKSDKEIIVTYVGGDVWGVFGMGKNELIGRNILKVGKMSKEYINRVMNELSESGFVFKQYELNGRTISSVLMIRDNDNLVEFSWVKEAIK
jgi:hypothetical protein